MWRSSQRSNGKERYVPSFSSISPLNALYHSHYFSHTIPALFYLHDFSRISSAAQVLLLSSSSLYNFSTSPLIFSHLSILSFFIVYYLFIIYLLIICLQGPSTAEESMEWKFRRGNKISSPSTSFPLTLLFSLTKLTHNPLPTTKKKAMLQL
jgi:hypothetical protein